MGVDRTIDITAGQRKTILTLLQRHLPGTEAWVYGSRAKWTSRPQSDLDLVVFATPEQRRGVGNLREAFEESDLPFRVDLFVWDEVPETFLEQIEAEHAVLAGVPTPSMSGKSRIAGEWRSINLGRVCTKIGSGATPRGGKDVYLSSGTYSLIRSQNVLNSGFHHDGLAYISEQHASELASVEVLNGDVLLNITGDSVARACQVAPCVLPARVNQHVAIIRPDPDELDPRFLRYYLVSSQMQAKLLSWASSGGTRNALTKGMIESFDVPAPQDIDEQRAIVNILGTLDDKIEVNRRMNETLEAMVRALFKSWFVDFNPVRAKAEGRDSGLPRPLADLFPARLVQSELGKTPDGWSVATLADHFEPVKGVSYKGSGLGDDGVPLHNLNSIYEGGGYKYDGIKYYSGEHAERHVVLPGDVIVANTEQGHERLLIGYAAVVPRVYGNYGIASHHIYRLRPRPGSRLKGSYLCFLLNSPQMHDLVSGFANGTTVNMLPIDALQKPPIVCPSGPLIEAFDALATNARQRCEELLLESRTLASLRDLLLPKLISGEIRLRDAEKAVEAVA